MAEEQRRWQEGHRLCSNNCGFFGSPATNDLCSNCYRDLRLKDHNNTTNNNNNALSLSSSSSSSSVAGVVIPSHPQQQQQQPQPPSSEAVAPPPPPPAASLVVEVVRANRCGECRKKVGLTGGFRCRCGSTYCGAHRHPESHACRFDFKSAGKDAIARANPLVRADKLPHKI